MTVFHRFWDFEILKTRELGEKPWEVSCCLLSLPYAFPRIFCGRLAGNKNFSSDPLSYSTKGFESSTP